ncbi:cation transporter [Rothia aeria]|uniref:Cation transporter n=1 Tax=Rothia aeria TaxID=172042 RepID=A0A2Z5QZ91_9MICC|nr:cation transporter [Rothia aeria]
MGLILALLGVSMTLLTGNGLWDAAGTLAIGVLLVVIAVFLASEMKSLILGRQQLPRIWRRSARLLRTVILTD